MLLDYVLWLANKFGAKVEWVDSIEPASWNLAPKPWEQRYEGNGLFLATRDSHAADLMHEIHHYIVARSEQREQLGFGPNMPLEDEIETCRLDICTLRLFDKDEAKRWAQDVYMEDDRTPPHVRTKRQIRDDVRRFKKAYVKQDVHS